MGSETVLKSYRKAKFAIDDDPSFEGFTNGQTWNGWECPKFTEAVARLVLEQYYGPENNPDKEGNFWVFQDGIFSITEAAYPDEPPLEVLPVDIVVDGEAITVYGIGAGEWVWDVE